MLFQLTVSTVGIINSGVKLFQKIMNDTYRMLFKRDYQCATDNECGKIKGEISLQAHWLCAIDRCPWISLHNSGMFCFTFNCHTLHNPPQEVKKTEIISS